MLSGFSKNLPASAKVFGVVLGTAVIFLLAQVLSIFILTLTLAALGWSSYRTTDWLVHRTDGQFLTVLLVEFIVFLLVLLVLRKTNRSLKNLQIKKSFSKADTQMVVAGFAAYFAFSFIAQAVLKFLIPDFDLEQAQQIGFETARGPALILVFLALCVAVPVGEEILFRGLLFRGLKKYLNLKVAAVATSLLFGIAHLEFFGSGGLNWAAAVDTAVFSAVLIWVYVRRQNLWVPIGLHALKNSVAFIFLFVIGS